MHEVDRRRGRSDDRALGRPEGRRRSAAAGGGAGIQNGSVDLHSPATTVALLKLDAVVGLKGTVETINGVDTLTRVGITCALCHSTVDDSFAPGIGKRLDGWPNRDLNPGAIIALSPALDAATKAVYQSWGPGKYDPRFNLDGLNKPAVIPPAYGLAGVHASPSPATARGRLLEPLRRRDADGRARHVRRAAPGPERHQRHRRPGQRQAARAAGVPALARGAAAAGGQLRRRCGRARQGGLRRRRRSARPATAARPSPTRTARCTRSADSMAEPESPSYASRSATKRYRTTPLRGVWQHAPYFHDGIGGDARGRGRAPTTRDARSGSRAQQQADLVQYLKSL